MYRDTTNVEPEIYDYNNNVLLNAATSPPVLLCSVFLPLLLSESTVFLNTLISIIINKLIYKLLSVYRFIHSVMPEIFASLQISNFLSLRGLISEGFSNLVLNNKYFYKYMSMKYVANYRLGCEVKAFKRQLSSCILFRETSQVVLMDSLSLHVMVPLQVCCLGSFYA